jgi:membrane dipeptidase
MPHILVRCLALGAALVPLVGFSAPAGSDYSARVMHVLKQTPLIDGHNDLPWELRTRFQGKLAEVDLRKDTAAIPPPPGGVALMTDIPRLRRGGVGGQFWSVWIPPQTRGPLAVQMTLEQIDLVHAMAEHYPLDLAMAYTAADVRRIHRAGRIASLIGIEGGHQINDSLAMLRQMYTLGARYMTLTHSSNTDWADSATDAPKYHGLTPFGREVVKEMNWLGMMVDLSHVSPETMRAALETTQAPVIFSHSSARALVDHPRDVPDDILTLVAANGGVVMVNFNPGYVSEARNRWEADLAAEQARYDSPPFGGLYIGQPERAKAALNAWKAVHPTPHVSVKDVADHIDHIKQVAGVDHVGIGSDFDGVEATPEGLDGVDKFPDLLIELMRRGWSDEDVAKVAGENVLRVLATVESTAARLRSTRGPSQATIAELDHMSPVEH